MIRTLQGWMVFLGAVLSFNLYASAAGGHADPMAAVILVVAALFFMAIIGRYIARSLHLPGVLGELLMGVLIGNIAYYFGMDLAIILREGSSVFDVLQLLLQGVPLDLAVERVIPSAHYALEVREVLIKPDANELVKIAYVVDAFSRYGVIFLLFMVGLESSVSELKHTGKESIWVALIGVIAPMVLGYGVAYFLLPDLSSQADLFIAATLSATSIGITARVLAEMNQLQSREARTILGAAMLDDILGLIILGAVTGIVVNGRLDFSLVSQTVFLSLLFFAGTLTLGPLILRKAVHFFSFLDPWEAKLFISFLFIMLLAWLASLVQLATIIGAFAAGVIMNEGYFKANGHYQETRASIKHLISPLESILAPMFFMVIGIQVKLETFYSRNVIFLATGLIAAAVIGKLLSGLGANRKDDRLFIGIGMLPRGEVGLVFASIGRTLGVISDELFSAIVLMVVVTTFIAPPLLKAQFQRKGA